MYNYIRATIYFFKGKVRFLQGDRELLLRKKCL